MTGLSKDFLSIHIDTARSYVALETTLAKPTLSYDTWLKKCRGYSAPDGSESEWWSKMICVDHIISFHLTSRVICLYVNVDKPTLRERYRDFDEGIWGVRYEVFDFCPDLEKRIEALWTCKASYTLSLLYITCVLMKTYCFLCTVVCTTRERAFGLEGIKLFSVSFLPITQSQGVMILLL